MKGVFKSVAGVWSGDIDLNDGALQTLTEELQSRLSFIQGVGLTKRCHPTCIFEDLSQLQKLLNDDAQFCRKSEFVDILRRDIFFMTSNRFLII